MRLGPTLTTSWGYRGGGQQSLVLAQMFVVRNVTMLRYTRSQRGEIYSREEVGLSISSRCLIYYCKAADSSLMPSSRSCIKHCWWYDICSDSVAGWGGGNL